MINYLYYRDSCEKEKGVYNKRVYQIMHGNNDPTFLNTKKTNCHNEPHKVNRDQNDGFPTKDGEQCDADHNPKEQTRKGQGIDRFGIFLKIILIGAPAAKVINVQVEKGHGGDKTQEHCNGKGCGTDTWVAMDMNEIGIVP